MKCAYFLAITSIIFASCTPSETPSPLDTTQTNSKLEVVNLDKFKVAMGQTIYVPVYSYIYHDEQKAFNLAATLSVRNTDLTQPIVITTVRYYNSNGKLVKQYLQQPIQLEALASTDFVINRNNNSEGLGANFIVEWVAQTKVSEPVVEAIMIGTANQQGISWSSPGRVIKSRNKL